MDPPRDGVVRSVRELQASQVKVVMITGDAHSTALNIADRLGIYQVSRLRPGRVCGCHRGCWSTCTPSWIRDMCAPRPVSLCVTAHM